MDFELLKLRVILAAQRTKIAFRFINLFHAKIKHSKIGFYDAPGDITYPRAASRIAEANLKHWAA